MSTSITSSSRVAYGEGDDIGALPWRWPADLVAGLRAHDLHADVTTIAYSVNGGYTPIQWKYLGDELAARLSGSATPACLTAYDRMRAAAEAHEHREPAKAEGLYLELGDEIGAAPHFRLAYLLVEQGRTDEARTHYQRTRQLAPSYRTAFSSPGMSLHIMGGWRAAGRWFDWSSQLDRRTRMRKSVSPGRRRAGPRETTP